MINKILSQKRPDKKTATKVNTKTIATALFTALTCFYILIGGGHIYTPDGVIMFRVSKSLLKGQLHINALEGWQDFGVQSGPDTSSEQPKLYAWFGLGHSVAAAPLVALGSGLARFVPKEEHDFFNESTPRYRFRWDNWGADNWPVPMETFIASWLNAIITAAWVTLIFLIGCELGFTVRASVLMALLTGLATPLTHYAQTFFSEPLAGLALTLHFWLMLIATRQRKPGPYFFLSGLALGWVTLTKIALSVLWFPTAIYLVLRLWSMSRELKLKPIEQARFFIRKLWPFVMGVAMILVVVLWYNTARFGAPFETGYGANVTKWETPFIEGFSGLLLSSGRGLLWYTPLVLISAIFMRRFLASYPMEGIYSLAAFASLLFLYARWFMWEGGWCWGPRFLLPIIPLLILPIGAALNTYGRWPTWIRSLFLITVGLSLIVSINGLLVNYVDYYSWLSNHYRLNQAAFLEMGIVGDYNLIRWSWDYSPLIRYWRFSPKDYFMLAHAVSRPGFILGIYMLVGLGFISSIILLAKAMHRTGCFSKSSESTLS